MKRILPILLFACFAISANAQLQGYSVGDTVADFTVTDVHGIQHNLSSYTSAGKYVFIDFFFVACGPCQQTAPIFNEFYDKYGCNGNDVICLSISGIDNNISINGYETSFGGSFNHAPAIGNEGNGTAVDNDFDPAAYPTICLIGPSNTIIESDIWPIGSVASFEAAFPSGFNPTPASCSIGLSENAFANVSIYPNPSSNGEFTIQLKENFKDVNVQLTDISGKVVFDKNYSNSEQITVNHNLPAGAYVLTLSANNVMLNDMIVVQ